MIKKSLILCAIFSFVIAVQGGEFLTEEMLKSVLTSEIVRSINTLPADEMKEELVSVKEMVMKVSPKEARVAYAAATAILYKKENPQSTYQEIVKIYENSVLEMFGNEIPSDFERIWSVRIQIANPWFSVEKYPDMIKEALEDETNISKAEKFPDVSFEYAQLMEHRDIPMSDQKRIDYYLKSTKGRSNVMAYYVKSNNMPEASKLFFEALLDGSLDPANAMIVYTKVISYEVTKEDADMAALKQKLKIGELVYKAKAHQWNSTSDAPNPWLIFISALQDTIKDL